MTNTVCSHEGAKLSVFRKKGSRIRKQCSVCLRVGAWEKRPAASNRGVLETLTVSELRGRAKAQGLSGYSSMKKVDIITMLVEVS